ncbi:AAA family ATPase [Gilvimarinus sp. F26214L]|uniref:AAA family ATPase n=1 Tax=Gilvimarinus sp. DZF01 TaxID=3461371 RepID=UPI004045EBB5
MKDTHDLSLLLDSRVPVVVIESYDEKRALDLLLRVANQRGKDIFRWTVTDGLARLSFGPRVSGAVEHSEPREILEYIKQSLSPSIFVLCDFHHYLEGDPRNLRLIKDVAQQQSHALVFLSHQFSIPADIARYCAKVQLSLPGDDEIMHLIRDEARVWSEARDGARVKTDSETLSKLVANLRGLSHSEVRRLVRAAIVDDGAITDDDIPAVNKAKFELMDMEGVLSFEYNTGKFSDVGGLKNLKGWLQERRSAFAESSATASDVPKGIMLTGVQGSGKSLAAKSVAGLWGLPLLRLDFASLYNKFFGETERNLREALKLAELMAPCVLWLDEIEKALSSDQHDNGTSTRVLGTFLTWMAERESRVFVVATSNDITALPPELLRKGRLDEVFFVDLPDWTTRREIFAIHLQKRDLAPGDFGLDVLASQSEGFSGAEIEQVVVAALYSAAARQAAVSEADLQEAILRTSPLSVLMAEKIAALRTWAEGRAVSAN